MRNLRDYANSAKTRMKEEMGPDFDDVEWRKLDPRQYDPRRIIRQALLEEPSPARNTAAAAAGAAAMVAPTMLHSGMAATPTSALEPLGGGSGENVDGQVRVIHFDSEAT